MTTISQVRRWDLAAIERCATALREMAGDAESAWIDLSSAIDSSGAIDLSREWHGVAGNAGSAAVRQVAADVQRLHGMLLGLAAAVHRAAAELRNAQRDLALACARVGALGFDLADDGGFRPPPYWPQPVPAHVLLFDPALPERERARYGARVRDAGVAAAQARDALAHAAGAEARLAASLTDVVVAQSTTPLIPPSACLPPRWPVPYLLPLLALASGRGWRPRSPRGEGRGAGGVGR